MVPTRDKRCCSHPGTIVSSRLPSGNTFSQRILPLYSILAPEVVETTLWQTPPGIYCCLGQLGGSVESEIARAGATAGFSSRAGQPQKTVLGKSAVARARRSVELPISTRRHWQKQGSGLGWSSSPPGHRGFRHSRGTRTIRGSLPYRSARCTPPPISAGPSRSFRCRRTDNL